jgi:hypothetical protein
MQTNWITRLRENNEVRSLATIGHSPHFAHFNNRSSAFNAIPPRQQGEGEQIRSWKRSAAPRRSFLVFGRSGHSLAAPRKGMSFPKSIQTEPAAKSPAEAGLSHIQNLPALASVPVVHLLLRPILGVAISLLKLSFELVLLAGDDVEIIIGQLSPLLLYLAFDLFPVSFDAIPVHGILLELETK